MSLLMMNTHYILNTVCLNDGKMLNIKLKDLYDLKLDINNLLHRYDLNPIKVNHYDWKDYFLFNHLVGSNCIKHKECRCI